MIKGYIAPNDLEKIVIDKLKNLGITESDYPLNPYRLILDEGIILQEELFDNENIRGMIVHGENATGILINGMRSRESKNFIAMHELSHHWFHPHSTQRICLENYVDRNKHYEWQANNAAAYALMPTKLLSRLFFECGGNIECLCDFFNVGRDTMTYRLNKTNFFVSNSFCASQSFCIDFKEFKAKAAKNKWVFGG